MRRGTLIAIEGEKDSGKTTQVRLLAERLKNAGYIIEVVAFPQYSKESSYFIRKYLVGSFGHDEQLGPYIPPLFYSLDRFDAAGTISTWLEEGKVVLADTYNLTSRAQLTPKTINQNDRRIFNEWLDQLEFGLLKLPTPDLSFVLTKLANNTKPIDKRSNKASIQPFLELTKLYKDRVSLIKPRRLEAKSITAVNNLLWGKIKPLLSKVDKEPPKDKTSVAAITESAQMNITPTDNYYVPETLNSQGRKIYIEGLNKLLVKHTQLTDKLAQNDAGSKFTRFALPIATQAELVPFFEDFTKQPESEFLTDMQPIKGSDQEPLHLVDYWPKNELSLISKLIYPYSTLAKSEIDSTTDAFSYDQKAELLKQLASRDLSSSFYTCYSLDILSSCQIFLELNQSLKHKQILHQPMTPHYGYQIPASLDIFQVEDLFEQIFDLSFKLYMELNDLGYKKEAQYVCLMNHKIRYLLTLDNLSLAEMANIENSNIKKVIVNQIFAVHPILATQFFK